MYEKNIEVLQDAVKSRSVIRHVSRHRNPDGSMDVEGNLCHIAAGTVSCVYSGAGMVRGKEHDPDRSRRRLPDPYRV